MGNKPVKSFCRLESHLSMSSFDLTRSLSHGTKRLFTLDLKCPVKMSNQVLKLLPVKT